MDALLIVSFGGPEGPEDVIPFLTNVTTGRGIPPERLAEVGAHYAQFGGVSPINGLNRALVAEVAARAAQLPAPPVVLWGNRNWMPYVGEAFAEARRAGADRLFVFVTSAYSSYSGCRQYRENLYDGLAQVRTVDWDPQVHLIRRYFNDPGFVDPIVDSARQALAELPAGSRLVFTTHSIPAADAHRSDYLAQHHDVAEVVAAALGRSGQWDLVFQSRSGAPHVPWLEPDISDHLAALAAADVPGVAIVPIGFVSDHMEVVWDLDTVAMNTAREHGLAAVRVATPGADPRFADMVIGLFLEARGDQPPRPTLGSLGPRRTPCAAGCCPNPRAARPALCGAVDW